MYDFSRSERLTFIRWHFEEVCLPGIKFTGDSTRVLAVWLHHTAVRSSYLIYTSVWWIIHRNRLDILLRSRYFRLPSEFQLHRGLTCFETYLHFRELAFHPFPHSAVTHLETNPRLQTELPIWGGFHRSPSTLGTTDTSNPSRKDLPPARSWRDTLKSIF